MLHQAKENLAVLHAALNTADILEEIKYHHQLIETTFDIFEHYTDTSQRTTLSKKVELLLDCYTTRTEPLWKNLKLLHQELLSKIHNWKQINNSADNLDYWHLEVSKEFTQTQYFIGQTVFQIIQLEDRETYYPIKILGIFWNGESWEYITELPSNHPDYEVENTTGNIWYFKSEELKVM